MRHLFLRLLAFTFVVCAPAWGQGVTKPLPADVRVVIDISGSMKKTDPQNLRKPAVDLLVRLLPDGSKAGIWTFGQSVNMLVPHRVVDQQWRSEASQKANTINSIALFTNIGSALEKASQDHATPSTEYQRNIILLTDGVVDVSKEAVHNLTERKRVLAELLPRLKSTNYRVHTIALSADSDQELMRKISLATDGISEVADSADELMSTFLRIFDQAVPAERLPLDTNGFLVDSSIQEFTALIFRGAQTPATVIVAPDGKEFSSTDPNNNVNWYRTDQYDLITAKAPQPGQWRVKTEMAAGSRVTVVSNLQLVVQPLKTNLKINQPLDLVYSFEEGGNTLTNKDFLSLLAGEAFISRKKSPEVESVPLTQGATADGVFRQTLNGFTRQGAHDLKMVIDGKTFQREFVHHFTVSGSAFSLDKEVDVSSGKRVYRYKLIANLDSLDMNATHVKALIRNSEGNMLEQALNAVGNKRWEFSFSPIEYGRYDVSLDVAGKELDGSPFNETIKADSFSFVDEQVAATSDAAASSSAASAFKEEVPADSADRPVGQTDETPSNLWLYVGIGIGNLAVLVLGYFIYRLIAVGRGRNDEIEKTLHTDVSSLQKTSPVPVANNVIDISDEVETAAIPMSDIVSSATDSDGLGKNANDMKLPDDPMADNPFTFDNMGETGDKDKA